MPIIVSTKNLNYEIIDQDTISNQEDNDLHSQNIWKQSHEFAWKKMSIINLRIINQNKLM